MAKQRLGATLSGGSVFWSAFFVSAIHLVMRTLVKFLLLAAVLFSPAQASQQLDTLKAISAAGAPLLALKMLDQAQPDQLQQPYEWILWEQERFRVLEQWQLWRELLIRLEQLPSTLPEPFLRQAATLKARAYLKLQDAAGARRVLRQLLWQPQAGSEPDYRLWRRLVLQSYLIDHNYRDARTAMLRYQQDFADNDADWQSLRARVLLLSGDYDEILIQEPPDHGLAYLQYRYAQWHHGDKTAAQIWQQAITQVKQESDSAMITAWWMLAWHVAEQMSAVDRVIAMENSLKQAHAPEDPLWQPDAQLLWQAYRENALDVSNQNQLLLGDYAAWQQFAEQATLLTPLKARTLLAHVTQQADKQQAETAARALLNTLDLEQEESQRLLQRLYDVDSGVYIPQALRHVLVDYALQKGDITTASKLMQNLEAPKAEEAFAWNLRRARVLVLGGQYNQGSQVLDDMLQQQNELSDEQVSRLLQVLFDLQTVKADDLAIHHFQQLLGLRISGQQRREILFWMGDSLKASEQFERAALLYLQSAMLPGPDTMDPWAQTARFNAAESLQEAGLVDDARRIYLALLKITKEPARKSLLRHNIQQLWLRQ